jgi:hypothetical protein
VFGCSGDDPYVIADDEGSAGSLEHDCQVGAGIAYSVGGRYTPNDPLDVFDGEDAAGYWTMHVSDVAGGGDIGTFESWTLILTGVIFPTEPAANDAGVSVRVWPNPTDGGGVAQLVLGEPASVRVDLVDPLGRSIEILHHGALGAGAHELRYGARSAGVYQLRAVVDGRGVASTTVVAR